MVSQTIDNDIETLETGIADDVQDKNESNAIDNKSYIMGGLGIIGYAVSSVGLVVINKGLYDGPYPYPLCISWLQQIVIITIGILKISWGRFRNKTTASNGWVYYDDWRKCFWSAILFIMYIGLANLALKLTAVSSYLIARSLTLPTTYFLTVYYLKENVITRKKIAVIIIVVSFFIGNLDFNGLTVVGVVHGSLSSISQAVYGVKSKIAQNQMQRPDLIVYALAVWSFFLLIPVVLVIENYDQAIADFFHLDALVYLLIFLSCIGGFVINWSVMTIIRHFSVLTYEVTGFAKSAAQPLLGVVIFDETLSVLSCLSTLLILVGSFIFSIDIRTIPLSKHFFSNSSTVVSDT